MMDTDHPDCTAPLGSVLDRGMTPTLGMSAGQPVAAGDLRISDVAVMPLMKLTQHSLPPCGPPRVSCSARSSIKTPPPAAATAPHAFDLMAIPMHSCTIHFCVIHGGQGRAAFVVWKVGHSVQTKLFFIIFLILIKMSVLFCRSCPSNAKRRAVQPQRWWPVSWNPNMIWKRPTPFSSPPPPLFLFTFIYIFQIDLLPDNLQTLSEPAEEKRKVISELRRDNSHPWLLTLPRPLLLPPQHRRHGEEKDSDSEDHWWTQQTGEPADHRWNCYFWC